MNKLENKISKEEIKKLIEEKALEIVKKHMNFTERKIGDTPTDDYMYTPRKYVNMYGSVSGRPTSSVVGQQYFATDLGYPIFKSNNGAWVNATGSVVG